MALPPRKSHGHWSLAAALLAAAAALLAPASVEASRDLTNALEPVATPSASLGDLAAAAEQPSFPVLTTADRVDLADLATGARLEAQRLRLLGVPPAVRYDAAASPTTRSCDWRSATENRPILAYDDWQGQPSARTRLFQGLWTDPVTGLAYARARWYDARNASWLSEDPLLDVDSPNLYAFVGWGPHVGTDPMGFELHLSDWVGIVADAWVSSNVQGAELAVNAVTLGGYGGVKQAYQQGELDRGGMAGLGAYAEGMASGLTFGWYGIAEQTSEQGGTLAEATVTWAGEATGVTDIAEGATKLGEGKLLEGSGQLLEGTGKVASLAALGMSGTRYAQAARNTRSLSGFKDVRAAQRMPVEAGSKALGEAGEKALRTILGPKAQYRHIMKQKLQKGNSTVERAVKFNGRRRELDALEMKQTGPAASEVKNKFLRSVDPYQTGWDQAALNSGRLREYSYFLMRGGTRTAIEALRGMGFQVLDFSPLMGRDLLLSLGVVGSQRAEEKLP